MAIGYEADFAGASGATVEVMPATEVSTGAWVDIRKADYQALIAALPQEEWDRAEAITRLNEPHGYQRYIDTRIHPNLRRGRDGINERQIFLDPLVALIRHGRDVVGGVIADTNISARTGLQAELDIKGHFPRWQYVRIRDAILHPDLMPQQLDNEAPIPISGLVISALYHTLGRYNNRQRTAAYFRERPRVAGDPPHHSMQTDPADQSFADLTRIMGMHSTGAEPKPGIPGYENDVWQRRVEGSVGATRGRLIALPRDRDVIERMLIAA